MKNTSQANASVPRGTAHFLCTYHIPSVRTIKWNQSEPIGTIPFSFSFTNLRFEWKSDLTIPAFFDSNENPFRHVPNCFHSHSLARTENISIQVKIKAQSNYQTIFDSNENQWSIKLPNNFRFKWKSELNQTGSNRCIGWYIVITNLTQIGVVRNQQASRNQRERSTEL